MLGSNVDQSIPDQMMRDMTLKCLTLGISLHSRHEPSRECAAQPLIGGEELHPSQPNF
jgi:hypothetical protein